MKLKFLYIIVNLITRVHINEEKITTLIDIEVEIFIISSDLTKKLKLFISRIFNIIIINAIDMIKRFFDLDENISINIKRLFTKFLFK